jgi:hypothetical protein
MIVPLPDARLSAARVFVKHNHCSNSADGDGRTGDHHKGDGMAAAIAAAR